MKHPALRAGIACGLLSPALWAAFISGAAAQRPGYSHLAQLISELGERGSSTELPMRYGGFMLTGALYLPFALALASRFRGQARVELAAALVGLGGAMRFVAGVFPCDLHCGVIAPSADQIVHNLAARLGYLALIGATLVWAPIFRGRAGWGRFAPYSVATGLASFVFLTLVVADPPHQGLFQRVTTGLLSLWVFVIALKLWQEPFSRLNAS